jgi:hypothetical protein
MDVHHRGTDSHTRNLGLESAFKLPCVVSHIRGSAAHIKADQPINARLRSDLRRSDDSAGWA